MDHWQYLIVLGACLVITAPLELFGAGIYRQRWRAARAIVPVAVAFLIWDAIAIAAQVWTYNPRYITGFRLPGHIPIEEVLFFVVIPLCGLLTYNAVTAMLGRVSTRKSRTSTGRRRW
jgi:lycopene cyclase domain-containing protein